MQSFHLCLLTSLTSLPEEATKVVLPPGAKEDFTESKPSDKKMVASHKTVLLLQGARAAFTDSKSSNKKMVASYKIFPAFPLSQLHIGLQILFH